MLANIRHRFYFSTVTCGSSVYADDIRGDLQDNDGEHDNMSLPRVIGQNAPRIQSLSMQPHDDADASDEEAHHRAMDLPPMKDMTVPEFRRDSIHMESFLTPEYPSRIRWCALFVSHRASCSLLQFMQSSIQLVGKIQQQQEQQQQQHQQQQQQQQQQKQQQQQQQQNQLQERPWEDWVRNIYCINYSAAQLLHIHVCQSALDY
jgi:hypothetical protein